jgi:hypothetical protein
MLPTAQAVLVLRDEILKKSGSLEPLTKRQGGRECFSGEAMQGEVEACARTLVKEKSKNLEEG